MIVDQDKRSRHMLDCIVKNLSRFSDTTSYRPDKNGLLMDDFFEYWDRVRHKVLVFYPLIPLEHLIGQLLTAENTSYQECLVYVNDAPVYT